jgi:hypothetical protein
MTGAERGDGIDRTPLAQRFLGDLAVVRSANTVRAYAFDLKRWAWFCGKQEVDPFRARPRTAIEFIRADRERSYRVDKAISARTLVRRLTAVRQWYAYLALESEETAGHGASPRAHGEDRTSYLDRLLPHLTVPFQPEDSVATRLRSVHMSAAMRFARPALP